MFTVDNSWLWPVNIAAVVIFGIFFAVGWKKGIIRVTIGLFGTIVSVYAAWAVSSVLGKYFRLWPKEWALLQDTSFAEAAYQYLNQICWFLVLFVIMRILFAILDKVAEGTQKLPVVNTISSLAGSAFALCEAAVLTVVVSVLLQTPLFNNGVLAVEKTVLKPVNELVSSVFKELAQPVMSSEALHTLSENVSFLTKKEQEALSSWLDEHGYQYNSSITEILP